MALIEKLTNIADAIREKTGGTEKLSLDGMAEAIAGISAGGGDEEIIALIERSSTKITIPKGTTKIGQYAFYYHSTLEQVSLPEEIVEIRGSAFMNCDKLVLTSLPEGVTKIGDSAFQSCFKLALTSLPEGITEISKNAFMSCTNLALTSLPEGVTKIGDSAFSFCKNLALTSLPEGIIEIGSSAFNSCKNLPSLVLLEKIIKIGSNAFSGSNIETVRVGSKATGTSALSTNAFASCSNLTTFDIASNARFSSNIFNGCAMLKTIVIRYKGGVVALYNANAIAGTPFASGGTGGIALVPTEHIESYKSASNWSAIYTAGSCAFLPLEEYTVDGTTTGEIDWDKLNGVRTND